MELEKIKERFIAFAESECKGNSELYYKLSNEIANDEGLLKIASNTRVGQPIPNIFFASVHYLLLKNSKNELASYYPSIQRKQVSEIPFAIFKSFCLESEDEIKKIISTRIVQTNVINRCAYLMPIFSKIIADENRPTTIIDIGTSAGLTLNFDKYEYWYNDQKIFGDSKVINKSTIIESAIPEIYNISQPILKIGIDQNIIDLTEKDEILWLKALVWTDQLERFVAIDEALKLDELKNIKFIRADTILNFEREILKADSNQNLIVYSTHVLYQFTQEQKADFYAMLERVGQERDFYFLSVEGIKNLLDRYNTKEIVIELTHFKNKQRTEIFLAETNGHGNWIKWNNYST
ncbi:DUF2332 domain-containing protein [Mucilaginibacter dorajii]|uniref:DUF2332 domain-containing protein n=1 Tax=Mucilaginibacter dorajii TaxID=692994 RepID=A0ABP7QJX9_9SPHI|nr:DUF2332 domain-containing protein [Mucilaginibacter dorajii]MCS3734118.1 hypothetical protein [Mucilaginibacter dorajii]